MLHKLKIPPQQKINRAGWKGHWPSKMSKFEKLLSKSVTLWLRCINTVHIPGLDLWPGTYHQIVWCGLLQCYMHHVLIKKSSGKLLNYKLSRKIQTAKKKSWVWLWCPIKDTTYNNTNVYFDLHLCPPQCKSTPPSRLPLLRPGFRMISFPHLSSTSWSQPMTLIVVWVHPGLKAPF